MAKTPPSHKSRSSTKSSGSTRPKESSDRKLVDWRLRIEKAKTPSSRRGHPPLDDGVSTALTSFWINAFKGPEKAASEQDTSNPGNKQGVKNLPIHEKSLSYLAAQAKTSSSTHPDQPKSQFGSIDYDEPPTTEDNLFFRKTGLPPKIKQPEWGLPKPAPPPPPPPPPTQTQTPPSVAMRHPQQMVIAVLANYLHRQIANLSCVDVSKQPLDNFDAALPACEHLCRREDSWEQLIKIGITLRSLYHNLKDKPQDDWAFFKNVFQQHIPVLERLGAKDVVWVPTPDSMPTNGPKLTAEQARRISKVDGANLRFVNFFESINQKVKDKFDEVSVDVCFTARAPMSNSDSFDDLDDACRVAFRELYDFQSSLYNLWPQTAEVIGGLVKPHYQALLAGILLKPQPANPVLLDATIQAFEDLVSQFTGEAYAAAMSSHMLELRKLYTTCCSRWLLCNSKTKPKLSSSGNSWPAIVRLWRPYHISWVKFFVINASSEHAHVPELKDFEKNLNEIVNTAFSELVTS